MRSLTLKMHFEGDVVGEMCNMEVQFIDDDGPKVSVDEALKGIAFAAALLFKNKMRDVTRPNFLKLMSSYINGSIDTCTPMPDRSKFN